MMQHVNLFPDWLSINLLTETGKQKKKTLSGLVVIWPVCTQPHNWLEHVWLLRIRMKRPFQWRYDRRTRKGELFMLVWNRRTREGELFMLVWNGHTRERELFMLVWNCLWCVLWASLARFFEVRGLPHSWGYWHEWVVAGTGCRRNWFFDVNGLSHMGPLM